MKDEIKEILDNIKNKYEDYYVQDIVSGNDLKLLLDYITNLQTIEQQYSAILSENAELENKITNLQEENEYSDYCNKKLREKITNLEYKITTLEDYKTRNEKAVEYIKNLRDKSAERQGFYNCFPDDLYIADIEELLNILQGEQNE